MPYLPHDFLRKILLMLYSVNSTNFVVCWPFVLEILSNVCMVIICLPVCEVINFEINVSILIKLFS